jgi:hypothetical protein
VITGAALLLVGLLLSPFAARLLPFSWNAGQALMKSTNPVGWASLAAEMNLMEPNHAVLSACRDVAERTKKEQRCTIVVPAPNDR